MPYSVQPAEAIKRLTQEVQAKQEAVAELEEKKEQLIYHQLLLHAVLNAFSRVLGSTPSAEEQQLLLQVDGLNLQPSSSSTSSFTSAASVSADTYAHTPSDRSTQHVQDNRAGQLRRQHFKSANTTIAPEHDPLGPVLGLLPRKHVDAASLTLDQLQQDYQCTIGTLAANIGLLEEQPEQPQRCASIHKDSARSSSGSEQADAAAAAAAAAAALCCVQEALQQYWGQLNVLLRGGRVELTHAFIVTDMFTGEQLEQHNLVLYRAAAQLLHLSQRQQQRITMALRLFRQLTEPAVRARQQLQQQLQDQPLMAETDAAAAAAAAESQLDTASLPAGGTASDRQGRVQHAVKSQVAVLQQQERGWGLQQRRQQQLSRLPILMRKEAALKHCASTCIQGCLSWKQMAQFALACFPHVASPIALAQAVEALVAEQPVAGK